MGISLDNDIIQPNDTIYLLNQNNETYRFVCSALNSKPDVVLSLYDTNTNLTLSNGFNNKSSGLCDPNNLCTQVLQVDFQFSDSRFINMTSLSCSAFSTNSQVDLIATTSRNVSVKTLSK